MKTKTDPNEPASPVDINYINGKIQSVQKGDFLYTSIGLTKREVIAKDFMAALITSGMYSGISLMKLSETAIGITDTFIKALNENKS